MKHENTPQEDKMKQLRNILLSVEADRENGLSGCTVDELDSCLQAEIDHMSQEGMI